MKKPSFKKQKNKQIEIPRVTRYDFQGGCPDCGAKIFYERFPINLGKECARCKKIYP